MLRTPSFEHRKRVEATRDLVNLVPVMVQGVVSRIDGIGAWLYPKSYGIDAIGSRWPGN
jgi:hypothetical protein